MRNISPRYLTCKKLRTEAGNREVIDTCANKELCFYLEASAFSNSRNSHCNYPGVRNNFLRRPNPGYPGGCYLNARVAAIIRNDHEISMHRRMQPDRQSNATAGETLRKRITPRGYSVASSCGSPISPAAPQSES